MNNKIIRTNERCYICDFSARLNEGEHPKIGEPTIVGVYQDGLCKLFQDERGRFVFLDPRDEKPICTQCSKVARDAVRDLEWKDRNWEARPWKESNKELFDKWEKLLQDSLARDAGKEEPMERETT